MLIPSAEHAALGSARIRNRRYALELEFDPADATASVWIISHGDVTITRPGTVAVAKIKDTPIKSQTLQLNKGSSTIGNANFSILDVQDSMTLILRDKLLDQDQGLNGKRVRFYSGFKDLEFDKWLLESTQIANSDVSYSKRVYRFSTRDALGGIATEACEPVTMNLAQPVSAETTTIPLYTTAGLFATERGTSYSDGSTPGQSYAYVQLEDEIIRVEASGILPTSLINVQRGALATQAAEHSTDETKGNERGKEVKELVYLEMPWPKLVLALLTGALYNQTGTLPAHHHAGLAGSDVDVQTFLNIGADFYDPADDTQGVIERWVITKSIEVKRFVERLIAKYGVYLIVDNEGQFRLKRPASLLDGSAVVAHLTADAPANIVRDLTVRTRNSLIQNNLLIRWNEIGGEPSRSLGVRDTQSVARHGQTKQLTIDALGWSGSRQTENQLLKLIGSYLEYYVGPPLELSVNTLGSVTRPEVGDIVRVSSKNARDFTSGDTISLDRSFLIVNKRLNLRTGKHTYKVFGSTARANPETPVSSNPIIPDSWYFSQGTDLVTLPGVIDTGTEVILPDGIILTGGPTVDSNIYYSARDLRVSGATTTRWNHNIQLRVRGNLTIEGDLGGGDTGGLVGVIDSTNYDALDAFPILAGGLRLGRPAPFSGFEQGFKGYYGVTQANGGIIEMTRHRDNKNSSRFRANLQAVEAPPTEGEVGAIPNYVPRWNGTALEGLPNDLRGTSGGPGGGRYWHESREPQIELNRGGRGGDGGPGILIVARGITMGIAGRINTSGQDGDPGVINNADERPAWSGAGAGGAPGGVIMVIDGATGNTPVLTESNCIALYGESPKPAEGLANQMNEGFTSFNEGRIVEEGIELFKAPPNRLSFYSSATSGRNATFAAMRYFFALGPEVPETDSPDEVLVAQQQITATVVEAFDRVDDSKLTVFQVWVTRVNVTDAYAGAAVYTREVGKVLWTYQTIAEDIEQFMLPSDGRNYEVQVRPVLVNGKEAKTGFFTTRIASDSERLPEVPNSLLAFDRDGGDHLVGQINYDPTNFGWPYKVVVYRSGDQNDPGPAELTEAAVNYDGSVPRFTFGEVIPDAAGQPATRYYWIASRNGSGTSARFPSGAGIVAGALL